MATEAKERWAQHLESWKHSGLTLAAYARNAGVSEVTLGTWKRRLLPPPPEPVSFVEAPASLAPVSGALVIEAGGRRIEVPANFDEDTLVRLLRVLETRP